MTVTAYRNSMSEKQLMHSIIDAARSLGYLVFHDQDSRKNERGFPDLVIVKAGAIFALETKNARYDPKPEQLAWLDALRDGRVLSSRIVRPADLDEVLEQLREAS